MTDFYTDNGKPLKADLASWSLEEGVTITGTWEPLKALETPEPSDQSIILRIETIRALGLEWWPRQSTFKATVAYSSPHEAEIRPLSAVFDIRAEWWRHTGFYVIARPYEWLSAHLWRPWARWILRGRDDWDEEDDGDFA